MIPEHLRCGAGTATSAIEYDVVRTGIQRKLNVFLYMICTKLETHRYTTGNLSDAIGKSFEILLP